METRRQAWLDQFYAAVDNDENAEVSTFDGSFAQTLMMMNGDLIRQAVSGQPGTSLYEVLNEPGRGGEDPAAAPDRLSRQPTPRGVVAAGGAGAEVIARRGGSRWRSP